MYEQKEFKISQLFSYPSHNDPFSVKETKEFGFNVGKLIYSEWFYSFGTTRGCRFYNQKQEFQERRNYAIGNIDMTKFYCKLGTNDDVSLLNLSKKPIVRISKLVDMITNGMCGRKGTIEAKAIDPISQEKFQSYRKQIKDDMATKHILKLTKETFGKEIGSMPIDKIPESNEELDIHLQMEWKPANCLSNELAIACFMEENMYEQITDRQVKRDLIEIGLGCVVNQFHSLKGIVVKRVDPLDLIWSQTKDPYFRDCIYKGHIEQTLVSEIFSQYSELDEPKRKIIENANDVWYKYQGLNDNSKIKGTVQLLYFTYKTTRDIANKIKYKKNGEVDLSEAKDDFDYTKPTSKTDKYKRFTKTEEVLFEGCMVLGTEIMLKWELSKSMARPKSNNQKVCEVYNMIAPNMIGHTITSAVSKMMPIDDKLHELELKAEMIIQGIRPDGIGIDASSLADIDLGKGIMTFQDHFNLYLQTGSFIYDSYKMNGDANRAVEPFKEVQTGNSINKLTVIRQQSDYYLTQLTDIIGLNKMTDATTPDKESLVGIAKIASLSSNQATRHILDAAGIIHVKTAETISYRISDILEFYPSLRTDLIRKIGATSVADLDSVKNLHLSDFAIYLTLEFDDEERAMLNQDLSLAIDKGFIGLEDKYTIMSIKVLNLAIQYLKILITKRTKVLQKQKEQEAIIKSDADIRSSQQSNLFQQETIKVQLEADRERESLVTTREINKEKERGYQNLKAIKEKGRLDKELQYIINEGQASKVETLENSKKENIAKQGTITSELNVERAKENPEKIDFEAKDVISEQFKI